jgi:hypothetical protein
LKIELKPESKDNFNFLIQPIMKYANVKYYTSIAEEFFFNGIFFNNTYGNKLVIPNNFKEIKKR